MNDEVTVVDMGTGAPEVAFPVPTANPLRIEVDLRGEIIAFATPCHSGSVALEYMRAMAPTYTKLAAMGVNPVLLTVANDSMITKARNVLVKLFLESEATRLFFIDSDMGWDPDQAIALIAAMKHLDKDIVAVAGPRKTDTPSFCAMLKTPMTICESSGMFEAETVGTGFLCIHRRVIEAMVASEPDNKFVEFCTKKEIPALFETRVEDGTFWSEDYMFCRKAKKLGFRIWVQVEAALEHVGTKVWKGAMIDGIRSVFEYFPPVKPLE